MKKIQTILSIIILILLNFHIFNFIQLGGEKHFIFQYNYYWYIIMSLLIMFNTEFSNVFHFKEKQFKTNDKLILFMQTILCIQLGLLFFFENTIALTISFIITIIIAVINMFNISKKENNIPYLNFKAINMFLIIYNLPCLVSIIQIVSKGGEILNSLQQFLYSGGFLIVQLFTLLLLNNTNKLKKIKLVTLLGLYLAIKAFNPINIVITIFYFFTINDNY